MYRRFSELRDVVVNNKDFVIRSFRPETVVLIGLFFISFLLVMFSAWKYLDPWQMYVFGAAVFIITSLVGGMAIWIIRKTRDMLTVTEFQSALFSAAASSQVTFFIICNKFDNTLLYYSFSFRNIINHLKRRMPFNVEELFDIGEMDDRDKEKFRSAHKSGSCCRVPFSIVDKNNDKKLYMLSISPIVRPEGFNLISATELLEAGKAAEVSHGPEYYASLFEQLINRVSSAVIVCMPDGSIESINIAMCKKLGFEQLDFSYRRWYLRELAPAFGSSVNPLEQYSGAMNFEGKNRKFVQLNCVYSPIRDSSGMIICMVMEAYDMKHVRDVDTTSHYQIEDLAKSKQMVSADDFIRAFNLTANFSPIPTAILTIDGAVRGYNNAFGSLLESCGLRDLISMKEIIVHESFSELSDLLKNLTLTNKPGSSVEGNLQLVGNGSKSVQVYLTLPSGEESGKTIIAQLLDTTEQKNLEIKYAHSQKMQAVGQLAGGIAHDFNNLLTAMIGFCDLLLIRHPAGDQSFADIMQIKQNAIRAANLVRQLLAFSRRQTLQPKILDVTDMLADLANLLRRLIGENIELKMIHGREVGHIKADQGQFEQVLINLAVNARDAMISGGSLTIKTSNISINQNGGVPHGFISPTEEDTITPGDYVLVELHDTGHGIPLDLIPKIFEPFFSTKEVGSGTGLGLATVYGVVKQTGGYIYVHSTPNVGTIFNIYFKLYNLPASEINKSDIEDNVESEKTTQVDQADLSGRGTILLVEDEAPVRIFSARALRNKGYNVIEADSPETALQEFDKIHDQVELVVTDVVMPGMNGTAMVEKLLEKKPALKVIFMSGYAEDVFRKSFGSERDFHFLPKPFTLKQLASKVKEVTQK